MGWEITQTDKHCFEIVGDVDKDEPFEVLITSDHHWDNKKCDRKLLKKHLRQAQKKDAPILFLGDTFCAMQGKFDKRADKASLRPEHAGECYFDELRSTAAEWYGEFADDIALITMGNHEESIIRHQQVNLLSSLCDSVNALEGPYWGFVRIKRNPKATPITLFFHHGWGGGGPVTKGTIDFNRLRSSYQADVYALGHIHHKNMDVNPMSRVTSRGKMETDMQYFLRSSTYKQGDEFLFRKTGGWLVVIN
jgi:hypothetical protein